MTRQMPFSSRVILFLVGIGLLPVIAVGVLCVSFLFRGQSFSVADVGQPQSWDVRSNRSPGSISGFTIRITGEVTGFIKITTSHGDVAYLHGLVNWKLYFDQFDPLVEITFEPIVPSTGSLNVHCQFH